MRYPDRNAQAGRAGEPNGSPRGWVEQGDKEDLQSFAGRGEEKGKEQGEAKDLHDDWVGLAGGD